MSSGSGQFVVDDADDDVDSTRAPISEFHVALSWFPPPPVNMICSS